MSCFLQPVDEYYRNLEVSHQRDSEPSNLKKTSEGMRHSPDSQQSKFNNQFGFLDEDEIFFQLINEKSRKSKTEYKGRKSDNIEPKQDNEVIVE